MIPEIKSHFFLLAIALLVFSMGNLITNQYHLKIDSFIVHWVSTFQTEQIIQIFIWITEFGNALIVVPFLVLACIILCILNRPLLVIPLLISTIGSTALTYMGKTLIHRPRPIEAILVEQSYSFPSGHATFAIGFYGFIIYLLMRHSNSFNKQLSLMLAGTGFILSLGFSRIILNVHYFSDVLVGYLIGMTGLLIGIQLTKWLVSTQRIDLDSKISPKKQRLVFLLLTCAFVYYLSYAIIYQPELVSHHNTIHSLLKKEMSL
ncbi:MAG: phosphatase PAP2 family protein [gamma proteobacterium symbiont of Bathyaustriella thionipta]|nr:phosphatase PAP2 family protein [gamma proteobacterium symbiont of Bathyaustriella thionipta]